MHTLKSSHKPGAVLSVDWQPLFLSHESTTQMLLLLHDRVVKTSHELVTLLQRYVLHWSGRHTLLLGRS